MIPHLTAKSRPGIGGSWVHDLEFEQEDTACLFPGMPLRDEPLGLPEVSEIEIVRHFMELSAHSHGVDNGPYPLGSCTMKYNPKRNDAMANLDGFRGVHPLQPVDTMQGILELLYNLQGFIAELMGADAVTLQPSAGAQGELTGLLIIRKYFEKKGEDRRVILIADSAHGTNPSSAVMAGFDCEIIPTNDAGIMDLDVVREKMNEQVAGIMLTNPSTLGLFEENIATIAEIVHAKGGLLYYDGANLNALMGIARPGDMGFDVMHLNTHKTLSTPHGGGGPGAGPCAVKAFLEEHLPVPRIAKCDDGTYVFESDRPHSIGRLKSFYGHVAVMIRCYSYILFNGPEGLKQVSEDAVLNANYFQQKLRDIFPPIYPKPCMHECLLSGKNLPTTPYNFAKRLIDYGVHPPTLFGAGCVYFPKDLDHAMLIEPTETETKASLDQVINVFRKVYHESFADAEYVNTAPHSGRTRKIPEGSQALDD
ncbi:aminomethyl-transferring glycine dehydrogenase subunit GcvPB [Nitrospina sp. 32_T5]|uniref:aminomethyl-transferring glycine dehydrogenase subunit GcvPB n=1 Tax=unclassified Nitrospina TaxID=2638683 RepID=UPI003F95CAB5